MPPFIRQQLYLSANDTNQLKQVIGTHLPETVAQLQNLLIEDIIQPFFSKFMILEITLVLPPPERKIHVSWSHETGAFQVLTNHLENLHALVEVNPPKDLQTNVLSYIVNTNSWTQTSLARDIKLTSISDIPWVETSNQEQLDLIAGVTSEFSGKIKPQQLNSIGDFHELRYFLLNNRKLIERTLLLPLDGKLKRIDVVHRENLPVPSGRMWGMVNGKLVPIG